MCMSLRFHRAVEPLVSALILSSFAAHSQTAAPPAIPANYDESQVGTYTLPDPLVLANGQRVRDADTWYKKRRPEIVKLFETSMQGRSPGRPAAMSFDVFDKGTTALDGKAIRRQVTVYFSADKTGPKMDMPIYLPAGAGMPVPLLLCLNFSANAIDDPGARTGEVWNREKKKVPARSGL